MWQERKRIEGPDYLFQNPVRRAEIELIDVFVDVVQIFDGFRVECEFHQAIDFWRAAARSLSSREASAPSTSWTLPDAISS